MVNRDASLGYMIRRQHRSSGLYTLLSGQGTVLGRSRHHVEIVAVLLNHLRARTAAPPSGGLLRLALRTVLTADSATLLGPAVGEEPGLAERQLSRDGLDLLDSEFVDVDPTSTEIVPSPTSVDLPYAASPAAHTTLSSRHRIERFIWLSDGFEQGPENLSSSITTIFARSARNGSRVFRLEASRKLADQVALDSVESMSSKPVLKLLRQSSD